MKSSTFDAVRRASLFIVLAAWATGCASVHAADESDRGSQIAPDRARRITPVVRAFQAASPAVVNISTTSIVELRPAFGGVGRILDDVFDFPFSGRPRRYKQTSVGSGFVIHRDGYIVTNAHVVARTVERKVGFADGRDLPAEIVAIDRDNDLAVLKVDAVKPLPFLELGRSSDLMQGETVIIIGNPLGYGHTVTTGIVSALHRELQFGREAVYRDLIQTDASINPGNSGGPMLNILGELVGVNTAIRGDAQNIGFAIPVDKLRERLPGILDVERLRRVSLGARFGRDKAARGVLVRSVEPGSPADEAGVRPGDIVTAVDGRPTPNYVELFGVLDDAPTGRPLRFEILQNGRRRTAKVTLAAVPRPDGNKLAWDRLGLHVRDLTRRDLRALELRRPVGVLITEVRRGAQVDDKGVEKGDLVTKIAGYEVTSIDEVGNLLEGYCRGDRVPVDIMRIGRDALYTVELALRAR